MRDSSSAQACNQLGHMLSSLGTCFRCGEKVAEVRFMPPRDEWQDTTFIQCGGDLMHDEKP